ncbi:MAG TPA: hypothetical protein VHM90_13605 [Phycisphaerae bacterium]|jgi:hypothetical protein|nr:hypothetical protein [Phycisphaerae bacterium]
MESSIPDRYEKNPMLVLVENYVLDAMGKLEAEKVAKLSEIVTRTFGGKDWRKALQSQLDLPADTPETVRQMWVQRQGEAEAKQEDLTAEDFAREMADQWFSDMGN